MNIAEIIELIKQLPPDEQRRLLELVKGMVEGQALHEESSVQYMDANKAKAVSSQIFSERADLFRKLAS